MKKQFGKYTFETSSKYADNTGPLLYHLEMIQKRDGGGWGILIDVVYHPETEILWFKRHIKLDDVEQFQLKVSIDKLSDVIDMYVNANNIIL
jgi:hypothetical protein